MTVPTYIVILVTTILAIQVHAGMMDKFQPKMDMPEVQKCMESTGFKPSGSPSEDFTPEQLCFSKCILEEKGMLDSNGQVSPDAVSKSSFPIPDDKKEDVEKCLADAGKVETCDDVKKLFACVPM